MSRTAASGLFFLFLLVAGVPRESWGAEPSRPRNALILYSYSRGLPWISRIQRGVDEALEELDSDSRPRVFEESLDASRVGESPDPVVWATYLETKYAKVPLDALITESQQAADFLLRNPGLFPGVPRYVLHFAAGSAMAAGRGDERRFSTASNMAKALETIGIVLPEARRIVIVNDRSIIGRARTEQILGMAPGISGKFSVEIWDEFLESELLERAAALPRDAAILYLPVQRDREGNYLVPAAIAVRLTRAAKVPVFSHFDSLLGTGIVGGYLVSGSRLGRLMGRIAAYGDGALPPDQDAYQRETMGYFFDSRELDRWRIPDDRLPRDSSVLYREEGFLRRYWGAVLAVVLAFALESALLAALVHNDLQRRRALALLAEERARLESRVAERTAELSRLNTELSVEVLERKDAENRERATAREKETLLRELQHRVKNSLSIIASLVSLESSRTDAGEAREILSKLGSRVSAMSALYDILFTTGSLDRVDLCDYLGRVAQSSASGLGADSRGIRVENDISHVDFDLKSAVALGLIVNELVTDSVKYGFPAGRRGTVSIRFFPEAGGYALEVRDDGVGLPEGLDPARSEGFGLELVRLLSAQLGGGFRAWNEGGARFRLDMPSHGN